MSVLLHEPIWLQADAALAIHRRYSAQYHLPISAPDAARLAAAFATPAHFYAAHPMTCRVTDLAARYATAAMRLFNNAAMGWVLARAFLLLNRYTVEASPAKIFALLALARNGEISEAEFADWLAAHLANA